MSATTTLPVSNVLNAVGTIDNSVVLSTAATSTNDVGTVTALVTASLVPVGTGLWIDQELMKVIGPPVSDALGLRYPVIRGQGGSHAQPHSSLSTVTIGSLDKFYSRDPKGRPLNSPLVSPWINTHNGKVWMPQGDSQPGIPTRWWVEVTNTYGFGPLGVRTQSSSPGYGT